ncbi:MAG: GNAT family N-acetyltransferase [Rubrobacteraceae bacterium]
MRGAFDKIGVHRSARDKRSLSHAQFEGDRLLPNPISIRLFAPPDIVQTSALHLRELPDDFVTQFGERFLARCHQAFAESPYAMVIVANDYATGRVVGALLGTLDAPAHYRWLVRHHGAELALRGASRAILHPSLGRDLVGTRVDRYARGIVRALIPKQPSGERKDSLPRRVGLLAHVMVAGDYHRCGIGSSLVAAYEIRAKYAGLDQLELATLPDGWGAGPFYERIGWKHGGERMRKSGERVTLYYRMLPKDVEHDEEKATHRRRREH